MHVWTDSHTPLTKKPSSINLLVQKVLMVPLLPMPPLLQPLNIPLNSHSAETQVSLSLIALQYHEVEIHIEFETLLFIGDGSTSQSGSLQHFLWVDYIFLDAEERKEFAANPHEYLIETVKLKKPLFPVQVLTGPSYLQSPNKELVWVCRDSSPSGDVFTDSVPPVPP